MQLIINGQQRSVKQALTVSQLLQQLNLAPERVVVELNKNILTAEAYATLLEDGDALELIQFVGGG